MEPSVKLCRTNFMRKYMLLAISLSDAKIPLKAKVGAKTDVLNHEGSCKNMLHMVWYTRCVASLVPEEVEYAASSGEEETYKISAMLLIVLII